MGFSQPPYEHRDLQKSQLADLHVRGEGNPTSGRMSRSALLIAMAIAAVAAVAIVVLVFLR
jgi:hypothetical protein